MVISKSSVVVHACSVLLGINSLISTSGLWVELPLMLHRLPEGWSLPSILTLIIQAANIGPILYGLCGWLLPRHVTEKRVCYLMLACGTTAAILLAFFWDRTADVWGANRSLALYVLVFCLALVDSLSSMVCFPFMAVLHNRYMTSYMIGEGFSGLLPSIFSSIQGVREFPECVLINQSNWTAIDQLNWTNGNSSWTGNQTDEISYANDAFVENNEQEPNMPIESFFYFLFALMISSWAGFYALNNSKLCRLQHVVKSSREAIEEPPITSKLLPSNGNVYEAVIISRYSGNKNKINSNSNGAAFSEKTSHDLKKNDKTAKFGPVPTLDGDTVDSSSQFGEGHSKIIYRCLLVVQTYMAAVFYGFLPAIQSYSCLPYGLFWYHLSAIMFSVASPVIAILYLWLPPPRPAAVFLLTIISTVFVGYITMTAILSPSPPLEEDLIGKILLFSSWTTVAALLGYIKVAVANMLRDTNHDALFWGGVAIQVGATSAAMLMFFLIVVYELFEEEQICG